MARKARVEIEGGLYHVITRGNDRQDIFHSDADHQKFLALLAVQKGRLPFFLYAYCLMSNHVHLLLERRTDNIGRIMHRVLTGYSQYYNWRYRKVGHVLQGRHKAILCQNEVYMGQLVRYIHLNPVRAKMVAIAEHYPYSSQRAYLGTESEGIVDVDPVLRLFGPKRGLARERFAQYVLAGVNLGHQQNFYKTEGGILGSEEFVDATIHRIGDAGRAVRPTDGRLTKADPGIRADELVALVERLCQVPRESFYGSGKGRQAVLAKELLIVAGRHVGASISMLSEMTGLNSSTISRRYDAATRKIKENEELRELAAVVHSEYLRLQKE